ncbi:efflux RND transporter periplasmic adaptor subunit [uncultured Roseivirga sp.]|uniref:efflux RND transporter periplasmic adaptor subunit n=1 Tax=uncultured Roseivirga sp. TaxID=543088 RepID=UPI0030DC1097|tara:strand:- start:83740 stop:84801 length:1062 start_codon:yes stop_codon:yes gene_type:complete
MKRLFLISTCFLLCLACKEQKEEIEQVDQESLRKQVQPTEVKVATAEYRPFEFLVSATGTIESEYELEIIFETSGYLEKLSIENGQRVKKGQVIGQLQNEKEKFAIEKAQAAYNKALVQYTDDSLGYSKHNEVMLRNLSLKSGLVDAEINLREAQINLENTIIKAPSDGIIVDLELKEGSLVSAGKVLCSIYDGKNLTLTAKILEPDFGFVKTGLIADVFPLARRDQSFVAKVSEINPRVDEFGMVQIELKLNQTDGLLPGMHANAIVRVPQALHIIVPREAVVIKQGKSVIFTVVNGLSQWKYVEIGLDNGTDVEVLDGLQDGDQVVLTNNIQLAHEAKVSIASEDLTTSKQ